MSRRTSCTIYLMLIFNFILPGIVRAINSKSPLLVWWPLNEGNGTVAVDHSGNGYDGVFWSKPQWVDGYEGWGLRLDGVADAVYFDFPAAESMDAFTVALWLKCETLGQGAGSSVFASYLSDTAGFQIDVDGGYPGNYRIYPSGLFFGSASRDWVHLTLVAKGTSVKLYYDGIQTALGNLKDTQWNEFCLGGDRSWSQWWAGTCDEFRVYNRTIGTDQVQALYKGMTLDFSKANSPNPIDGSICLDLSATMSWNPGDSAVSHDVYIGENFDDVNNSTSDTFRGNQTEAAFVVGFPGFPYPDGLVPGTTYYWRVDEVNEADPNSPWRGDIWSFSTIPLTAFDPSPADGSDSVFQAPILSWKPPKNTVSNRIYFSEELAAVEAGDVTADKGAITDMTFKAGLLLAGTTYYWRVDETSADGNVQTGKIWSFTTGQPITNKIVHEWWTGVSGVDVALLRSDPRYPNNPTGREFLNLFEGRINWKENYGSRLYGWLTPPISGEYTFWIASDDCSELWLSGDADPDNAIRIANVPGRTPLHDFDNVGGVSGGPTQKSAAITLVAGQKYYTEAIMKEGGDDDNIAVAWQPPDQTRAIIPAQYVDTFALVPLKATAPFPKDGAVDTGQSLVLRWFAGEQAVEHDVYFGNDAEALADADTFSNLYRGRQTVATWETGDLQWDKIYYWRIDEIADGDPKSPWKGTLWSFTTADFISVDDFESYTDNMDANEAIYQTWIDGVTNGTGSYVGYEFSDGITFSETEIVHGGSQSMPLEYNNAESPHYSQTERIWTKAQDWTINGVDSLILYIRGKNTNDPDVFYVALQDSTDNMAVVWDPDPMVTNTTTWTEWKTDLSNFTGVDMAKVKKMYIGVGDRNNPQPGAGRIYIDDICLTKRRL